ncbi:hypothetical protein HY640_02915 [Candidatus Woesearchaeota archaeon]|nr:hypothetical protein [Candidatus Woesearchaeota archaeon]
MGILSFFSPQTEERLHQKLAELLSEYHKLKALIERHRALSSQITHIHSRIDSINSGIRQAQSIQNKTNRMNLLQQLVQSEKGMLSVQKRLATDLKHNAERIIHSGKKLRLAADPLK